MPISFPHQRQIAQSDQPKQSASQQDPEFANKIIQLAINRTGKSTIKLPSNEQPSNNNVLHPNSIASTSGKPTLSKTEIERGKQDIETISSDLKLLSTLLGRPISPNDLPQLTQQFGGGTSSSVPQKRYPSSTPSTTSTTKPPAIVKEVELLQSLLRSPNKDIKSQVGSDEFYGNTDEAILATILKQKGIGPSHNNIPIEVIASGCGVDDVNIIMDSQKVCKFLCATCFTISTSYNNINRLLDRSIPLGQLIDNSQVSFLSFSNYSVKITITIRQPE